MKMSMIISMIMSMMMSMMMSMIMKNIFWYFMADPHRNDLLMSIRYPNISTLDCCW